MSHFAPSCPLEDKLSSSCPFPMVLMSFQKQSVQSVPRIRGISQREKHERWWCKWCTSWISYKTKTRTLFSSQLITRFEHGQALNLFILQVKWWTQVDNDTKMSLNEQVLKCLQTWAVYLTVIRKDKLGKFKNSSATQIFREVNFSTFRSS